MKDNKLIGNYLGIVIANNDPSKKGRLKIFIPHLSPSVYNNWHQTNKDKKFKFLGDNVDSPLTEITEELKDILPWAECASPIMGEIATGRYNSLNKQATISDSNDFSSSKPQKDFTPTKYSQNPDGTGEKPANIYEKPEFALKDAFTSPAAAGTNKANLYGTSYKPASYSNKAKGSFSIPPVGSHVWVFFNTGDPMQPVYFAASHSAEAWQGLYEFNDYPDSYENKSPANPDATDHNVETYRNKYIMNQKGGTLEFVNTDSREALRLTHYSGSFIHFTNPTTIYLATANEQHLIQGDKFETIRGSDNFYTDGDSDNTVRGDVYRKIGSLDSGATSKWKTLMQDVADVKQRFEVQRVTKKDLFNSLQQDKSGQFGKCPVCQGGKKISTLKNDPLKTVGRSNVYIKGYPGGGGSPGRSILNKDNYNLISDVDNYTFIDPKGVFPSGKPQDLEFPSTARCPACNGTGKSPSSMGGTWQVDTMKQQIAQMLLGRASELSNAEAGLGMGGHEVIDVTKHKIETIGTVMNDFGSIRVDSKGKMYNTSVLVDEVGVYEKQDPSPLIEYVHVDDLPGGNYTLNVCNRYTLNVGAGGVSLKTYGPVQIGGTVVNMSGEQVNIASANEVNIDGGKRLTLTSDILVLKQRQMKQVMIDSSLGISRNLVVAGGAHIEGELTVNHITAPTEIQTTEKTKVYGVTNDEQMKIIGYVQPGAQVCNGWGIVWSMTPCKDRPQENCLYTYPHSHHFRNLPLTLTTSNTETRKFGAKNNAKARNVATSQNNASKNVEQNKGYDSGKVDGGISLD